jgi:hypothetical protein
MRSVRVRLQLSSKLSDVDPQILWVAGILDASNLPEQVIVSQYFAGVHDQLSEKIVFLRG